MPVSAVKYYQREGLLPQGEKTAPNQTAYSEAHVERVRLIRALMGTGGLSIAATKEVIRTLDTRSPAETYGLTQHAISKPRSRDPEPSEQSRNTILELARDHGWACSDDNPGVDIAASALEGLMAFGIDRLEGYLQAYASAAESVADFEVQILRDESDATRAARFMVVGTVLGDPLFSGLRRIAHQKATWELFGSPTEGECPPDQEIEQGEGKP